MDKQCSSPRSITYVVLEVHVTACTNALQNSWNFHILFKPHVDWIATVQSGTDQDLIDCKKGLLIQEWGQLYIKWSYAKTFLATLPTAHQTESRRIPWSCTGSVWGSATPFSTKDGLVLESTGPQNQVNSVLPRFSWSLLFSVHTLTASRYLDKMAMEMLNLKRIKIHNYHQRTDITSLQGDRWAHPCNLKRRGESTILALQM